MNVDPNKIQAMINILQSMLVEEEPSNISVKEPEAQTKEQAPVSFVSPKKSRKPPFVNKFDKMIEKNMHKEDTLIDKKLQVHPPVARVRTFNPISVKCRVCGKEENISPQAFPGKEPERYKCNKCCGSPG